MSASEEAVRLLNRWYRDHRERRERTRKQREARRKRRKYERKLKKTRRRLVLQAIAVAVFVPLFLKYTGRTGLASAVGSVNHWFVVAGFVLRKPISERLVEEPDIDLEVV